MTASNQKKKKSEIMHTCLLILCLRKFKLPLFEKPITLKMKKITVKKFQLIISLLFVQYYLLYTK